MAVSRENSHFQQASLHIAKKTFEQRRYVFLTLKNQSLTGWIAEKAKNEQEVAAQIAANQRRIVEEDKRKEKEDNEKRKNKKGGAGSSGGPRAT